MTRVRAALIGLGAFTMAYAVLGAVTGPDVDPLGIVVFLAAVLVAHDLVWMPVLMLGGALLARVARPGPRLVVRTAAIVALPVLVVGVPLVVARPPADNPSVLPLDYGRNLLFLLVAIGAAAALVAAYGWSRKTIARRTGTGRTPGAR